MARQRYVFEEDKWIPAEEAKGKRYEGHYVITDEMDAAINPADGRVYTSKGKFRQATRANGCIEIGNEKIEDRRSASVPGVGRAIAEAMEQIHSRR